MDLDLILSSGGKLRFFVGKISPFEESMTMEMPHLIKTWTDDGDDAKNRVIEKVECRKPQLPGAGLYRDSPLYGYLHM